LLTLPFLTIADTLPTCDHNLPTVHRSRRRFKADAWPPLILKVVITDDPSDSIIAPGVVDAPVVGLDSFYVSIVQGDSTFARGGKVLRIIIIIDYDGNLYGHDLSLLQVFSEL
jgi:hypothetical protein